MKAVVSLGASHLSIPKKIVKSRFIVSSMTGNANFTTPSPTLAVITTNVNALEAASLVAQSGGVDDTANMRVKEAILDLSLKSLGAYVEGIANASPLSANAIILSAGMDVKGKGGKVVREFVVNITGNPGEVKLVRKGIKHGKGSYEFQMTTDPSNEASWQKIYTGTVGSFVKGGLISGTRYHFRATAIDKNGFNPWSEVRSTIAL